MPQLEKVHKPNEDPAQSKKKTKNNRADRPAGQPGFESQLSCLSVVVHSGNSLPLSYLIRKRGEWVAIIVSA